MFIRQAPITRDGTSPVLETSTSPCGQYSMSLRGVDDFGHFTCSDWPVPPDRQVAWWPASNRAQMNRQSSMLSAV
jgi:hypothetical protein